MSKVYVDNGKYSLKEVKAYIKEAVETADQNTIERILAVICPSLVRDGGYYYVADDLYIEDDDND